MNQTYLFGVPMSIITHILHSTFDASYSNHTIVLFQILTKDSVTVSVDAVVYYRVYDPVNSVINVEDASHSTRLLSQTTLRNILGTKTLAEILGDRDVVSSMMQVSLSTLIVEIFLQLSIMILMIETKVARTVSCITYTSRGTY